MLFFLYFITFNIFFTIFIKYFVFLMVNFEMLWPIGYLILLEEIYCCRITNTVTPFDPRRFIFALQVELLTNNGVGWNSPASARLMLCYISCYWFYINHTQHLILNVVVDWTLAFWCKQVQYYILKFSLRSHFSMLQYRICSLPIEGSHCLSCEALHSPTSLFKEFWIRGC